MRTFAKKPRQPHELTSSRLALGERRATGLSESDSASKMITPSAPNFGHDFSRIPVPPAARHVIQAKLPAQRKDLPEMTGMSGSIAAPSIVHEVLRSSGKPLDTSTRAAMEARFGRNLSNVHVHDDAMAAQSASSVGAAAYSVGNDIVFAKGRFDPPSAAGNALLSHELAHVVLHGGATNSGAIRFSPSDSQAERDANTLASGTALPVAQPASRRTLYRFATDEHVKLGEIGGKQEKVTINGVELTYGEVIAMGDFFGSVDDLYDPIKTPKPKLEALVAAIRREAVKPGSVTEEEWDHLTDGRYLNLARNNATHFSPTNPAILPSDEKAYPAGEFGANYETSASWPDNQKSYQQFHKQALDAAKKGDSNKAMGINAFADHFLTDAFAAGHLVNKFDVVSSFTNSLNRSGDAFFQGVAAQMWSSMEVRSEFSPYTFTAIKGRLFGTGGIDTVDKLKGLLQGIQTWESDLIPNAATKTLHDDLNVKGVMVSNAVATWRTFGDSNLDRSPETLKYARMAVEASQGQVRSAAAGTVATAPYTEVWKLVPKPTTSGPDAGLPFVADEARKYTDAAGPTAINAIAELTKSKLATIIDKLVDKGVLERTQAGWTPMTPADLAYPSYPL